MDSSFWVGLFWFPSIVATVLLLYDIGAKLISPRFFLLESLRARGSLLRLSTKKQLNHND
jgi:hypothetical protein